MKELLHEDDVRTDAFAEGRSEGLSQGRSEGLHAGIAGFIQDKIEDGTERSVIIRKLERIYSLSAEEAEKYVKAIGIY